MGRYIIPTLLLIISIGSFVVLTNPLYAELKTLREKESAYSSALLNARKLQEVRDSLLTKYNQFLPADIERIQKLVPDSVDNLKLAFELADLGSKKGLTVENISFDPNNKPEKEEKTGPGNQPVNNLPYDTYQLEFVVKGKYPNFINFLADLEKSLRIVDIVSVDFNASTGSVVADTYTYNVTVKTYRLRN